MNGDIGSCEANASRFDFTGWFLYTHAHFMKLISDEEGASGTETPKAKYYSNYGRIYLAFRFGKKKR